MRDIGFETVVPVTNVRYNGYGECNHCHAIMDFDGVITIIAHSREKYMTAYRSESEAPRAAWTDIGGETEKLGEEYGFKYFYSVHKNMLMEYDNPCIISGEGL